jgi:very-short-patch-repair endonuclease
VPWEDVARRQAGAIDRTQLAGSGLSQDEIRGLIQRRHLRAVLPGVMAHRSTPSSVAQREWAAVLWSGGVLSHWSAARRWELPVSRPDRPHVTVADRRFRGRVPGVRVHRVPLPGRDRITVQGLDLTSRPRTIIDVLRLERYGVARDLRDRALQQGWIEGNTLLRAVVDHPGRTGNVQLRRLHDETVAGAQAESERILHRILRGAGLGGWQPQFRVTVSGRCYVLDVAFPDARLAIEVDGRLAHGPWSDRFDDDRTRQNDLIRAGWRVLRFTWTHLQDPAYVLSQIVQLLAAWGPEKLHDRVR